MSKQNETAGKPALRPIVYVREADRDSLPPELQKAAGKIYAIHDASGNQLALAPDRRHAFALARRNDLLPISVH
ncbi:hypothetical protein LNKW23_20690 [Paralimibaculum aggregatum]|uniref:DUF1150 domain-containing protein n=1 Tax=Paralimibaculum aggregatum TaxID=3036245 RepID=A0ABQ6LKC0_9RHOB|nr:DUF1150 family protein [Limibaculum sp. NKW23]GMG82856.1 hypothetical protein LNKW23_20690 [Limibaculum sp. NKW23]